MPVTFCLIDIQSCFLYVTFCLIDIQSCFLDVSFCMMNIKQCQFYFIMSNFILLVTLLAGSCIFLCVSLWWQMVLLWCNPNFILIGCSHIWHDLFGITTFCLTYLAWHHLAWPHFLLPLQGGHSHRFIWKHMGSMVIFVSWTFFVVV